MADTSVGYDFDVKLPLYAAAGIPEVWILDVNAQQITQHSRPDGNVYLEVDTFRKGMKLKSTVLDFELDLGGGVSVVKCVETRETLQKKIT